MKRILGLLLFVFINLGLQSFAQDEIAHFFGPSGYGDGFYKSPYVELVPSSLTNFVAGYDLKRSTRTESGGKLTVVDTVSGAALDLVTLGADNSPVYSATGMNGNPTATFDGNDFMYVQGFPDANWTLAQVQQVSGFGSTYAVMGDAGGTGRSITYGIEGLAKSQLQFNNSSNAPAISFITSASQSHEDQAEVMIATLNTTSRAGAIWVNGIKTGIGTASALATDNDFLEVFAFAESFAPPAGSLWSGTYMYSSILTDAQIVNLSRQLMRDFDIAPEVTLFVDGHSGNRGMAVDGYDGVTPLNDSLKGWSYQLQTSMAAESVQMQVVNVSIAGSVIEDQDTLAAAAGGIDGMVVPYPSDRILVVFGCGNNISAGDTPAEAFDKLMDYIANRSAAEKYTKIVIITEMPGVDAPTTVDLLAFNDLLRDNWATVQAAGATHLVDLQTAVGFQSFANFQSTYAVSDDLHPNEAGCLKIAELVKDTLWPEVAEVVRLRPNVVKLPTKLKLAKAG